MSSVPSNQQLIDSTITQLKTTVTAGVSRHVVNGRDITRIGPKEQLEVLEKLEARQARGSRRPFSKLVARGW